MKKLSYPEDALKIIREAFIKKLDAALAKFSPGTKEITLKYKVEHLIDIPENKDAPKPFVLFTTKAWIKMLQLIQEYNTEVAAHGIVKRDGLDFLVEDILVYPQTVRAATVDADEVEYPRWLMSLDDDTHNSLRFQFHSHVNMGATPSGTDNTYYNDMLAQINDFYIFAIFNKSLKSYFLIFDKTNNIMYEDEDIGYDVMLDNENWLSYFLDEAKKVTKSVSYSPPAKSYADTYNINGYQSILDFHNQGNY